MRDINLIQLRYTTHSTNKAVLSTLHLRQKFVCYMLEREDVIISPGRFKITLQKADTVLNRKYYERFPNFHQGMIWIRRIPRRRNVYMHIGNEPKHSKGCPLTGTYPVHLADGSAKVVSSTDAYKRLYGLLLPYLVDTEEYSVYITVGGMIEMIKWEAWK